MTNKVNRTDIYMNQLKSMQRQDRWVNEKNSFGGSKDPMTHTSYYRERNLTRQELEALYIQDWLARRVVNIPASDATRNWISLTSGNDNKLALAVEKEFSRLKIRNKVTEAIRLGRLHGGALLIVGAFDGQETDMPLRKIRSVEFADSVDRWQTFPQRYYLDPNNIKYGQPETYLIHRLQIRGTLTAIVHESRVIKFDGHYLPPLERMRNLGWSASVVQNFHEELKRFGTVHQSAGSIIQDFITKKVQIKGLRDLLSNDEGEAQLMSRFAMLAYGTSVHNLAVFGDDEQYDKMGTPMTGLDKMMTHFVDMASAACEIPKSRLFHNQSGILGGDSGENDLRVHYDTISAYQENDLRPLIQRIVDMVAESLGAAEGEVEFKFNPLWQLSELDESTVRKNVAEADKIYIDARVVEPEEVAVSRFGGDGTNLTDMIIDVDRRNTFLDELSKTPIDLNEGGDDETDGDDLKDKVKIAQQ